jgi:hypothetical protein
LQRLKALCGRKQMLLSDEILHSLRPHAIRQRRRLLRQLAGGFFKQIHKPNNDRFFNRE